MAQIAATETNKFVGISSLHVIKGGFAANFGLGSGSLVEIPVAEDGGFTYTGGEPSIEHYKIHGLTADWTSRTTPGETSVNLFVPSITKSLLQLFGFTVADASGTSAAGKDITSGFMFAETSLAVTLGIAAINDEGNKLFGIKAAKLSATIVFDEANSAKPIGISLTGSTSAGGDADAMGIFELDVD